MNCFAFAFLCLVSGCLDAADFLADFAGTCDGIHSDVAAWNAATAALSSGRDRTLELPAGQCIFDSPPIPLPAGVRVRGQGKSYTVLNANYSGSFLELKGNGSEVSNLTIWKQAGRVGGFGIWCMARNAPGEECGNFTLEHLWITGQGTWSRPLYFDGGSYRTVAPLGVRTPTLRDVSAFNGTDVCPVTLWGTVGLEWFGGGVYQGFGSSQLLCIGGPNSARNRLDLNAPTVSIAPGALR